MIIYQILGRYIGLGRVKGVKCYANGATRSEVIHKLLLLA